MNALPPEAPQAYSAKPAAVKDAEVIEAMQLPSNE
jgi:hypothetical protein